MKKEIFLFGNSMCCTPENKSYLDLLKKDYDVNGLWFRGMTIWHVDKFARNIVRGDSSWIIINVGVTEAITRSLSGVIYYWMNEFEKYGVSDKSNLFFSYLKHICIHPDMYHNIIEPSIFNLLFDNCLNLFENHKIIVIGLAYPQNIDNENRFSICELYNDLLRDKSNFIDVWNKDFSVDEAHLNENGHKYIYNLIKEKINE